MDATSRRLRSVNPATEEVLAEYDQHDAGQIDEALDRAVSAFEHNRSLTFLDRAGKMATAADILVNEKDQFARLATKEMGKPLKAAIAEVEKCASACRHYAEHAERYMADHEIKSNADKSWVRYLPIGPVLAVMPWNFPFWQVFRFAAPALMAGNVGLLKHASNVPGTAQAIEEIFRRAGFDAGEFQTLLIGSGPVEKIIKDDRVRAVTLTGSEKAGASVAATAAASIKKAVLELGGSDPFIVMPSCDLESTVKQAVTARTLNNGQSCIAAKRFIVHADVYDDFAEKFARSMDALKVGDPMEDDTAIGPLAMPQIRDDLVDQVEQTLAKGAKRLAGAEPVNGRGYFYKPGVIADIPEGSPGYSEEFFGPVALLFRITSLEEAITLANATRFGLGSSIWTSDREEQEQAINRLEAGATHVNSIVASDPRLPFGGVKSSGFGRELSAEGIREFLNVKTVAIG
jgi:succinate-semialdehyde dehydrogenase / glutarate-semialdehyde dehydrogenase